MTGTRARFAIILLLAATACSPGNQGGGAPYTIAAAGPWQLSHGRNTRLGIELAVKEINEAGGVNGHKLIVKEADDRADGATAAQIAQKFVDDPSVFDTLTLRMRYDDGFIAYLNGIDVARSRAPDSPVWNSAAACSTDSCPRPKGCSFRRSCS